VSSVPRNVNLQSRWKLPSGRGLLAYVVRLCVGYLEARPGTLAHAASGVLHRDAGNTLGLIVLLKVAVDERAENVLVPSDQF
jgi:hypothetical protein